MDNTTKIPNTTDNTKVELLKKTSFFKIRTTVGKIEKFSSIIFILSGIEALLISGFAFLIVPQISALDKSLNNQTNWLSWIYLCLLGLIVFVQVIYGVYLRHRHEQGNEISSSYKLITIVGIILSLILFSFIMGQLITSLISPLYHSLSR